MHFGGHIRGHSDISCQLLVLSHSQLHSGSVDVHNARPGVAQLHGRFGLTELHMAVFLQGYRSSYRRIFYRDAQGYGAGCPLAVRIRVAVLAASWFSLHAVAT